jgi:rhamnulokinase
VEDEAALTRVIFEGLALAYRLALERAERLAGTRAQTVHIVGGGARSALLCQLTADACGRPVVAGPVEATAMGNILVQAMGTGAIRDLAEARSVACESADPAVYQPAAGLDWEERAARLQALRDRVAAALPVPGTTG